MLDWIRLSEERIKKAYEEGEFQNLPGFGRPLKLDDEYVPEELRMAYRLLKNANYLPEEANWKKELLTFEDLLKSCKDEEERKQLEQQLNEKRVRYNQWLAKKRVQTNSSIFKNYEQKIEKRLTSD